MVAMDDVTLLGARLAAGLLAGVYVAFLVAVMPALHGLDDAVFVSVMNRINEVIVNPAFVSLFLGAPLLAAATLWWERGPLAIGAAVLAGAALVITIAANLPLNAALADGGARQDFEVPWMVWHSVRTATAVGCFGLLCRVAV
jgi:uncharacterized membrane protein